MIPMGFTSYAFFPFLAALFLVYYAVPKRYQWVVLLCASYLFYALAGTHYLLFIGVTTVTAYSGSLLLDKLHLSLAKAKTPFNAQSLRQKQRRVLFFCLALNFGLLAILKTSLTSSLAGPWTFWTAMLPLGISFYTFQSMGYLMDVYRGKTAAERNLFKFSLFVSYFPQLIQGPISRFDDLSQTLFQSRAFHEENLRRGLQRMLWGLFKKMVIADRIGIAVQTLISDPEGYRGAYVLLGMFFYALQLYSDFTGGIDITLGISEVLGIKLKENFNRPYASRSIAEYWRRWHITLGTWFRDYVFYPASVCKPVLALMKITRKHFGLGVSRRVPIYSATILVWFITGYWHGSSFNFILWGLLNGAIILISYELEPIYEKFHRSRSLRNNWVYRAFQVMRTLMLMSCLRLLDCYRDVPTVLSMFFSLFTEHNYRILWDGSLLQLGLTATDYYIVLAGMVLLLFADFLRCTGSIRNRLYQKPFWLRWAVYYGFIFAILLFGAYGSGFRASQFIYHQF